MESTLSWWSQGEDIGNVESSTKVAAEVAKPIMVVFALRQMRESIAGDDRWVIFVAFVALVIAGMHLVIFWKYFSK